ncbi:MAG: tRNA (N(6)-L-threonylcarbamoyladenosine(37)-C(2))-methylthiotransferase MtaB [Treponemataceae bacterium]|nr:tRNA (N(6)-L-threonylcarbamoyladenosine(37)-C(2))-methylthiotransferase MtaB [Treponemataceae bacterium]
MIPIPYSVHFETLGCKLNQIESEAAAKAFSESGFPVEMKTCTASSEKNKQVFLCVLNTCTVTTKAEQKARRIIRLLLSKFPQAAVLVTGCYAEVEPEEIQAISERIAVLRGTEKEYLSKIPSILLRDIIDKGTQYSPEQFAVFLRDMIEKLTPLDLKKASFTLATDTFLSHSRASVKIQDGCNCNCSYCRIHLARGKSVSLSASEVLERIKGLERAGQKEVVITGVNLSQYYSSEAGQNMRFPELMSFLLSGTSTISFRISSLYPDIVTDAFCSILADERIRPHFHLSVQSGSDRILRSMNRPYGAEDVIKASRMLRAVKTGCFLAADIITGFPGETEEDFSASMELCRECDFSWVHVFPFSPRPGTKAFSMRPQVPQSISGDRAHRLTELALIQKKNYLEKAIGKQFKAVIEKRRTDEIRAVTENFIHIRIPKSNNELKSLGGKEVTVSISRILPVRAQTESVEAEAFLVENQ